MKVEITVKRKAKFNIFSTAVYEIKANGNKVDIGSSLMKKNNNSIEFKDIVKKVCVTNEFCWVLLNDGSVHVYDFVEKSLQKVPLNETIIDITSTTQSLFGVTNKNQLYQISLNAQQKICDFPKHQKVKKIVSGDEHCLILTSNGDTFSFGCGLRGVLGHDDVNSSETPKQIEALAGLKIIDIAAGSFHSIAISSFGDVYSWGWNTNRQLGLPKVAKHTFKNASERHQQVFTTPQVIDLEDDEEPIKAVFCGSKHNFTNRKKSLVCRRFKQLRAIGTFGSCR